MELLSKKSLVK